MPSSEQEQTLQPLPRSYSPSSSKSTYASPASTSLPPTATPPPSLPNTRHPRLARRPTSLDNSGILLIAQRGVTEPATSVPVPARPVSIPAAPPISIRLPPDSYTSKSKYKRKHKRPHRRRRPAPVIREPLFRSGRLCGRCGWRCPGSSASGWAGCGGVLQVVEGVDMVVYRTRIRGIRRGGLLLGGG